MKRATTKRTTKRTIKWMAAAAMLVWGGANLGADEGAAEWPQWRGAAMSGAAAQQANPPTTWNEQKNVKWKVKIPGSGSATPIIWKDKVFVQTAVPTAKTAVTREVPTGLVLAAEAQRGGGGRRGGGGGGGFGGGSRPTEPVQFTLMCLDRQTGKTLWQKVAKQETPHEGHHRDHGFSSYSPVTDGQHVYAFFGSRGLHCYDMEGNLKWQKDFGRMQTKNGFGEGTSPALHGNTLVINWDHEGTDFIAALNKTTGDEIWRQPRDEDTTWSTPLIVEHEGKAQVVTAASKKIRSYDLATGKQIWECDGLTANVIPTPVAGNGMVYLMSGFRGNELVAIKLGRTGDLTGTDAIAWSHNKSTPYVPSPLLYGQRLYFFASNSGRLSCLDAITGKPVMEAVRVEGLENVYASPVGAADRIYMTGRDGTSVVIKHADKLEILATNKLDDKIDASPAVAGNELFLRGKEYLYCIAEK